LKGEDEKRSRTEEQEEKGGSGADLRPHKREKSKTIQRYILNNVECSKGLTLHKPGRRELAERRRPKGEAFRTG